MKIRLLSVIICTLAVTSFAAEPPELIARRADHLRAISRVQIPALTSYIRTLEPLKQQFSREGKADAAVAVDAEIKSIQDQLNAAQAAINITTAAPVQLQIESATYGHQPSKRVADVTAAIRSAVDSGAASIVIANKDLGLQGADPAPGAHKTSVVIYRVNGKRKEKILDENATLNLRDLK